MAPPGDEAAELVRQDRAVERRPYPDEESVIIDDPEAASDEDTDGAESRNEDDDRGAGPEDAVEALNQYARRRRHVGAAGADFARPLPEAAAKPAFASAPADDRAGPRPKEGWIYKVSGSFFVGWQMRWFSLRERQLRWYVSPRDTACRGVLDFDLVVSEVEVLWGDDAEPRKARRGCCNTKRRNHCAALADLFSGDTGQEARFRLRPLHSNRAFELQLDTVAEAEEWVAALVEHIRDADKRSQASTSPRTFGGAGMWWKAHRISPEKFERLAETGDVLLFKSRGTFPRLIRAASGGGRFDHVGLILKLSGGEIGILEATGNEGVGVVTWKEFMANGWQLLYPDLALRRVRFPRSPERLGALEKWCGEVIGRPYSLTVGKLLRRTSASSGGPCSNSDFFCSQLVAEALKVLEVIPRGCSSTQFWPSTFSSRSKPIECLGGCEFVDDDLIIDFSLMDPASVPTAEGTGAARDATAAWQ